ncbi:MAG: CDP-diacylglycerol--glycerol-3-phosphate 3-phosphatidyltransferase [Planctomycetota bacterium]
MKVNLPNQITLARLFLAVVFIGLLAQYEVAETSSRMLDGCAVLFVVAALTDWLDGYLARRSNQVTSLGRVLDPFVDKILVCGAFVLFIGPGFVNREGANVTGVAPWMVVLMVGRELLVSSLRGFSESQGQSFAASLSGKAKMGIQSITVPVIMVFVAHPEALLLNPMVSWLRPVMIWVTVMVTVTSMVSYLLRARHILRQAA